jgi:hypothetical protein
MPPILLWIALYGQQRRSSARCPRSAVCLIPLCDWSCLGLGPPVGRAGGQPLGHDRRIEAEAAAITRPDPYRPESAGVLIDPPAAHPVPPGNLCRIDERAGR